MSEYACKVKQKHDLNNYVMYECLNLKLNTTK